MLRSGLNHAPCVRFLCRDEAAELDGHQLYQIAITLEQNDEPDSFEENLCRNNAYTQDGVTDT